MKLLLSSIRPKLRWTIVYGVCIRLMGGLCKVVELAGAGSVRNGYPASFRIKLNEVLFYTITYN